MIVMLRNVSGNNNECGYNALLCFSCHILTIAQANTFTEMLAPSKGDVPLANWGDGTTNP